jgi:hypothetical protein
VLPSYALGFHGCDAVVARRVFAGTAHLSRSENDFDWLGEGIYFWENSPSRALQYAREVRDHPRRGGARIKTPAVVGAVIEVGYCLNLMDAEFLSLMREAYDDLAALHARLGLPLLVDRDGAGERLTSRWHPGPEGRSDVGPNAAEAPILWRFRCENSLTISSLQRFDAARGDDGFWILLKYLVPGTELKPAIRQLHVDHIEGRVWAQIAVVSLAVAKHAVPVQFLNELVDLFRVDASLAHRTACLPDDAPIAPDGGIDLAVRRLQTLAFAVAVAIDENQRFFRDSQHWRWQRRGRRQGLRPGWRLLFAPTPCECE